MPNWSIVFWWRVKSVVNRLLKFAEASARQGENGKKPDHATHNKAISKKPAPTYLPITSNHFMLVTSVSCGVSAGCFTQFLTYAY